MKYSFLLATVFLSISGVFWFIVSPAINKEFTIGGLAGIGLGLLLGGVLGYLGKANSVRKEKKKVIVETQPAETKSDYMP